ncbi:hypothetical protein B296_00047158, partial [Ensete ventricosum]
EKESPAIDSLPVSDESRERSISPREKESPAGDSSLASDESREHFVSPHEEKESPAGDSLPAVDGRCGELVKVCFSSSSPSSTSSSPFSYFSLNRPPTTDFGSTAR